MIEIRPVWGRTSMSSSSIFAIFSGRRIIIPLIILPILIIVFLYQFPSQSHLDDYGSGPVPIKPKNSWLVATISAASGVQRREIIRSTWQTLYRTVPMTTKFVVADPGPLWSAVVAAENETYGDIIILNGLPEDRQTANTIKTMEFFKWLVMNGQPYTFVSKMDDDSFINARGFMNKYLEPLAKGSADASVARRIIGRKLSKDGIEYPGGQFYTVTWDLVNVLASLQTIHNITNRDEDWLVGTLLKEGDESWNLSELNNRVAFDYDQRDARNDTTAWAKDESDQDAWTHAIGPDAINPHKMKDDETYLRVADCFDERGLKNI